MLEQRCTLITATESLKAGMFIHIHGYVNEHGEKSNVTVHADASYDSVYSRSAKQLDNIEKDESLSFEVSRNAWVDKDGNEYTRKANGRTLKTNIEEVITIKDKDFAEAVAKVRKGIVDPKKVTDNFEKVGNSVYDNNNTQKTYLRNVLVHEKVIVRQGCYPVSCSARVNVIADAIRSKLSVGQYRTYVLDDEYVTLSDGSKEPRFEYVALMGDQISSSSSSSEEP